jgi:integrase
VSGIAWNLPLSKIMRREDVAAILKLARENDLRDYAFFATGANTALRLSEVVHLRVEAMDGDELTIQRRKKRRLEDETILISASLRTVLKDWCAKKGRKGWVFPGESGPCVIHRASGQADQICDGGHVSRREMQRRWSAYRGVAGLDAKGRGIHSLRHYGITEFYRENKDLRAAQIYAGHSSSAVTERYAHVLEMEEMLKKVKPTL